MHVHHIYLLTSTILVLAVFGPINCELNVCGYDSEQTVTMCQNKISPQNEFAVLAKEEKQRLCQQAWGYVTAGDIKYGPANKKLTTHLFNIGGVECAGILCTENPRVVVARKDGNVMGFLHR